MSLQPYIIDGGLIVRGGPTTLTDGLNIATPSPNDNSNLASNTEYVQRLVSGILNKSVTGSSTVYLTMEEIGYGILSFGGTVSANFSVIIPNDSGKWVIVNNTSFILTIKTNNGSGVDISPSGMVEVWSDGVNVYSTRTDFNNISISGVSTSPTGSSGDNSLQIANNEFVQREATNAAITYSIIFG